MISTRSRSKERNSPQQDSPYKTRSKRKSQDQKNDLRQFQESAEILLGQEEMMTIRRSFSYLVSLSNKTGWLRIDKLWTFDDTLKIEATCFTKPSASKSKKEAYGQDQLIGHRAKLLLNADRFKRMLVQNKPETNNKIDPMTETTPNVKETETIPQEEEMSPRQPLTRQNGSVTLSTKRIIQRTRDMAVYYQLKNPVANIVESISANAVVHSLGFARFNAGTKKKNPEQHGENAMNHKFVREAMVLDYSDYCLHRKLKKLLESGGVVLKEEAEKFQVVTDHPICIFYTNKDVDNPQQKAETWISRMDNIDDVMYEEFSKHSKVDDEQIEKLTSKYRRQTI